MALDVFYPGGHFEPKDIFARKPSGHTDARVLAAGVAETHTPPAGANYVLFSGSADFYARPNADPVVPSSDVTDGSAGELNPTIWSLEGVTTIRLIAGVEAIVTLSFYR